MGSTARGTATGQPTTGTPVPESEWTAHRAGWLAGGAQLREWRAEPSTYTPAIFAAQLLWRHSGGTDLRTEILDELACAARTLWVATYAPAWAEDSDEAEAFVEAYIDRITQ